MDHSHPEHLPMQNTKHETSFTNGSAVRSRAAAPTAEFAGLIKSLDVPQHRVITEAFDISIIRTDRLPQGKAQLVSAVDPHCRLLADADLRGLAPRNSFWRDAQFDTIRLCLIKIAGRVTEMVTRIKVALPSAFPYQAGVTDLASRIAKLPP